MNSLSLRSPCSAGFKCLGSACPWLHPWEAGEGDGLLGTVGAVLCSETLPSVKLFPLLEALPCWKSRDTPLTLAFPDCRAGLCMDLALCVW